MRPRDIATIISRAERFLARGEPLLAFDVIGDASAAAQKADVRLRQLQGLALARAGATERAKRIFEGLRASGNADEESLGILARTYKDAWLNSESVARRREFVRLAAEAYLEAHRSTGGYWSGINAATLHLLSGREQVACQLAAEVRQQCMRELNLPAADKYWLLAAIGEAALIQRDLAEAERWYRRAARTGRRRYGNFESTRRNARLILKHWKHNTRWIDQLLPIPPVVVFAGHMIDRLDRLSPRFPPRLESHVAKAIRSKLDQVKPAFSFSSASSGADILFLEAMLERKAEITVVLPFERDQFIGSSVDFIPKSNWRARFDAVLARAARIIIASPQRLEVSGASYEFSNNFALGLAMMRARQLGAEPIPLAVWDGRPAKQFGGTATVVELWRSSGYKPQIINLQRLRTQISERASASKTAPHSSRSTRARTSQAPSRIIIVLFADAVGFSKLSEGEIPQFVRHFLGAIAKLTDRFVQTIVTRNTWGDGLYLVFSNIQAAGDFGLQLAELVASTDWTRKGLPKDIGLRIALNAGPAYEFEDPITKNRTYFGAHVSRAARIEPITPRNHVYASEAFAVLAAAKRVKSFACDYVGQTPLAKGYGSLPTYHVRRTAA